MSVSLRGKKGKQIGERCYDACRELCPENVTIYNNNTFCALKINRSEEVLANCEKVFESKPNNIMALHRKAMA